MATTFTLNLIRVPNPRFAYTYKNTHPTWCSLISEDCLFYPKGPVDEDYDEEYDGEDPVLVALERDIADIRKKQSLARRRLPQESDIYKQLKANSFDGSRLWETDQLLELINSVAIGRKLTREVSRAIVGPVICAEFCSGTLVVNNTRDIIEVALAAIKSIRTRRNPVHAYQIESLILYHRLIEADSLYWMFRWSWEKLLTGDEAPIALYRSIYDELAVAGTREAMGDFRSLKSGKCGQAVTETWFLTELCRAIDTRTIRGVLADYSHHKWVDELPFEAALNIAELKGEVNYLSKVLRMMMVDPVFTEVRSRQDANFVWFLKFEGSFQEAENRSDG